MKSQKNKVKLKGNEMKMKNKMNENEK